jgi:hypothetical protein
VGRILHCLSTGAHRGWYDFHDSVQMLVESVVSCPQSKDGSLVRSCQLVVTVLLLRSLEEIWPLPTTLQEKLYGSMDALQKQHAHSRTAVRVSRRIKIMHA